MRTIAPLWLAVLLAPGAAGCGSKDRTPEGAVELFVRAAQEGDAAEVFRLLAPRCQQELQRKARLANAQAAGRPFKPEDLLATGREVSRYEVTQIRTLSVQGDRARVEIADARKGVRESLELERVGESWRVVLPSPAAGAPSSPASAPASQRGPPRAYRPTPGSGRFFPRCQWPAQTQVPSSFSPGFPPCFLPPFTVPSLVLRLPLP
jgi:hypothetical protein